MRRPVRPQFRAIVQGGEEDAVEHGPLIRDVSLMEPEDWRIVRSTPLFGSMSKDVTARLVGSSGPKFCEKGTLLFQQGDRANAFYVILEGWVKIARLTPEGSEAVVGIFRRGETFAEAAMFLGGRYPANAEVVAPSRLLKIDGENLRRIIRENPDLAFCMLASASYHLKFLVEQIEQIKLLSAPQRIADFLIQQCRTRQGSCVVVLPYEKALIASRLGMKPESFSRAIGRLRNLGVSVDHECVSIANVGTLIAFVEKGA